MYVAHIFGMRFSTVTITQYFGIKMGWATFGRFKKKSSGRLGYL
jgi:hypothetical protein